MTPTRQNDPVWTDVDRYATDLLVKPSDALRAIADSSEGAGLPPIAVSAAQGKFLKLLAQSIGARRILDTDRPSYPRFLPLILSLSRVGTLIVADNVVRTGAVVDPSTTDAGVLGVRQFNEDAARHPRLDATLLQTVGAKGYDGFVLARVIK